MAFLDPRVIVDGFKPIEQPQPLNQLTQLLQLQHLQGQSQMGQLQLQQAQQSADETNKLRQLFSDPSVSSLDPNTLRQRVMAVAPITGQPLLKNMTDAQTAQATLTGKNLNNHGAQIKLAGSVFGEAAKAGPQAVLEAFQKLPEEVFPAAMKARFADQFQADPVGAAQRFQAMSLTPEEQIKNTQPKIFPTDAGLAAADPQGTRAWMIPGVTAGASSPNGQPATMPGSSFGPPGAPVAPVRDANTQAQMNAIDLRSLQAGFDRATNPQEKAAYGAAIQQVKAGVQIPPSPLSTGAPVQQAPQLGIGAKPQGHWGTNEYGQNVYLPNNAIPGQVLDSGGQAGLSKSAIENAAARYNLDGTLPPMGMGKTGAMGRKEILDRAAELQAGVSGTDQRISQMDVKAAGQALGQLSKQQASISAFEKTANANAQLALDMSNKLDRTGIPILNAGLQFARTNTGSPEAAQFHAAVATFVGEYAKVMSGGSGGGPTSDAARAKASSLLTESMTQDQFRAVVQTLQTEMKNRMDGFNQQAIELKNRMRGQNVNTNGAAPEGGSVPDNIKALLTKYGGAK